jgi:hypothetical protein
VIRAIRLWLLGVEPDGPPVLADPLYRYEARRYWTPGRYLAVGLALAPFLAAVAYVLYGYAFPYHGRDFPLVYTMWLLLLARGPLTFVASTGAALCIAPEKVSGQLEQFILTPVDSWRFCLARLAGRLKGLMVIWAILGGLALLAWPAVAEGLSERPDPVLPCLAVVLGMHLDLAVMLTVDAAVGMRFTATCRSTPAALVKTYLTNFVLTPVAMFSGAMAGGLVGMTFARLAFGWYESLFVFGLFAFAARLGLGALAVRVALRDARNAIRKTFYEPEG